MKSIHVLRKPCSRSAPTVAANVLRYGTGGLNIEECRVGTSKNVPASMKTTISRHTVPLPGNTGTSGWDLNVGRWPANLIFQHLDGCVQDGVKKVKGQNPKYANEGRGAGKGEGVYESGFGPRPAGIGIGHSDPDGTETVTAWVCVEGCPVAALDAQSGVLRPRGNVNQSTSGGSSGASFRMPSVADAHHLRYELSMSGGASRFFKQVGGMVTLSGGGRGRTS